MENEELEKKEPLLVSYVKKNMPFYLKKAVNEVKPDSVDYSNKEKIVDKTRNALSKTGDVVLGTMVGDGLSNLAEKGLSKVAIGHTAKVAESFAKDSAKNIKEVGQLADLGRIKYNKMLIDEGKKIYAENPELAKVIYNDVVKNGLPPETAWKFVGKLNQRKLPLPESYDQVVVETKRLLNNSIPKELEETGRLISKNSGKLGMGAGLGIVGFLLSPIESLKNRQDQHFIRKAKEDALFKLFAYPGESFNPQKINGITKMSNDELDKLFEDNLDKILDSYNNSK